MKTCTKCKNSKPNYCFYKSKKAKDGLREACKECVKLWAKDYEEIAKEKRAKWAKNNPEKNDLAISKSREKHREKNNETVRVYKKNNLEKYAFLEAKRRSDKLNATPSWLSTFDEDYIKNIYLQSQIISELTKIKHEVDHIIPLRGKLVSGLHVPWNLQILTAEENRTKSNKTLGG